MGLALFLICREEETTSAITDSFDCSLTIVLCRYVYGCQILIRVKSVFAPEEGKCRDKKDAGRDCQQDDRMPVGALGCPWGGGGVIAALSAAL